MNHDFISICRFKGSGGALPKRCISNTELSETLDTSDDWIQSRTGICQRYVIDEKENLSDLAYPAAQKALEVAGLAPDDLDFLILATSTPDNLFPPTAIKLIQMLGAENAVGFDINVACTGFLYALINAQALLEQKAKNFFLSCRDPQRISRQSWRALIIGAETMSRLVDWSDRSTAVLFGDGAGAVVLELCLEPPSQSPQGIIGHHWFVMNRGYDQLYVSSGPGSNHTVNGHIVMEGREVFRQAVGQLEEATQILLKQCSISSSEIDWIIPHQANKRILLAVAEKLSIPFSKIIYTGNKHANTGAASIPLALSELWQKESLKGKKVLFQAFGAGFSGATCLAQF